MLDRVLADKGYSSRKKRKLLRSRGIAHTLPSRRSRTPTASGSS